MKAFKKVTVWCKEHSFELVCGGIAIGAAVIGYHYGYEAGEVKGKIEASNHYRKLIPDLVEGVGWHGVVALRDWCDEYVPEANKLIADACESLTNDQCDIFKNFYEKEYVKNILDEFSAEIP